MRYCINTRTISVFALVSTLHWQRDPWRQNLAHLSIEEAIDTRRQRLMRAEAGTDYARGGTMKQVAAFFRR
jgi:hypothetical protein